MSCECVDTGDRKFPSSLGCFVIDGYSNTLGQALPCFAEERVSQNSKVDVKVRITSDVDLALFTHWFFNEIKGGTLDFFVDINAFGIKREWAATMSGSVNIPKEFINITYIEVSLNIVDDIGSIIEQHATDLLCGICN